MSQPESSLSGALKDRQVVPNWRSPAASASELSGGSESARQVSLRQERWLARVRERFSERPTPASATELVETSFVLGAQIDDPAVLDLANDLGRRLSPIVAVDVEGADPVDSVVHAEREKILRSRVSSLRATAGDNPRRPLIWSELSRAYISLGQAERARNSMLCALRLSPDSKYLLRSATRLFNRLGEPDHALKLLRKHKRILVDPDLLSAEVATSTAADRSSRFLKVANELLGDKGISPKRMAELAAAVATVEHINGKHKRAKVLFDQSLIDPTANALAQAYWASEQDRKILIPDYAWDTPHSHEADALAARGVGNWERVLDSASLWLAEEPFELRAAALGSYAGFIPQYHVVAEQFASAGLVSAPDSALLLNNRAVARAYAGNISGALKDVEAALQHCRTDPHFLATLGLVAFRAGLTDIGREAYAQSTAWFAIRKDREPVALAALHWVREEIRLQSPRAAETFAILQKKIKATECAEQPDVRSMMDVIERELAQGSSPANIGAPSDLLTAIRAEFSTASETLRIPPGARALAQSVLTRDDDPIVDCAIEGLGPQVPIATTKANAPYDTGAWGHSSTR